MKPISIPCTMININAKILLPKRIYWERDRSNPNTKGRCCVSNQRILCNNPSIFVRYPSFWRKPGFPGGTWNACKRYCAEKEKNIFYTLDTHTVHFKSFVLAYLHRKALRPHDGRRLNNFKRAAWTASAWLTARGNKTSLPTSMIKNHFVRQPRLFLCFLCCVFYVMFFMLCFLCYAFFSFASSSKTTSFTTLI